MEETAGHNFQNVAAEVIQRSASNCHYIKYFLFYTARESDVIVHRVESLAS